MVLQKRITKAQRFVGAGLGETNMIQQLFKTHRKDFTNGRCWREITVA